MSDDLFSSCARVAQAYQKVPSLSVWTFDTEVRANAVGIGLYPVAEGCPAATLSPFAWHHEDLSQDCMPIVFCPDEKPSVLAFARNEQKPGLVIILSYSHEPTVLFSREYLEERHDQEVLSRTAQGKRDPSSNRHGLRSGTLVPVELKNSFRVHQLVTISNCDVVIALWAKMT